MVINVGINGFGRIGRVIFRTCCQHPDIEIAAINDPAIDLSYICYLIKFDSTHGKYNGNISYEGNEIKINDHSIMVYHQKAPCDIPWQKAGVQYVIEASGMFTNMEKALGHLASDGVRRVLVTAPSSDVPMLILGVNQDRINPDLKVISCTSSTLYCLAPIIKLMQDEFGVEEGFVTSIHAMTPSLKPLDGLCIRGKHWRDHRSIHQNIIPAATGACKALGRIIPAVRGKLAGLAFRVPIVNVSVLDLCIRLSTNTTMEEITECIEKNKNPALRGIIQVSKEQAVSSDFIGDSHSCTVDVDSCLQLRPNFFKIICWYENEFSYACRVVDTIMYSERQRSLIFTPLTKMTYVRPIFKKANSEKMDNKNHTAVECVSFPKCSLSPCKSYEARSLSRPIQRPLSPYVSETSKLSKRSVMSDDTNAFRVLIDKFGKSSSVKDRINLHENSGVIEQIYHERVKTQERLELVKQECSRMVNITKDLLKKPNINNDEPVVANNSPSEEITGAENSNTHPSVLSIRSSTKGIIANENSNNHSLGMAISHLEEITDKENLNTNSSGIAMRSPLKGTSGKENLNTRISGSIIRSCVRGLTEAENLKAHSFRTNLSKGTTEKENSDTDLSKSTTRNSPKEITEMENLNDHPCKGITGKESLKAHLSGLAIKSPSKGFTGKEKFTVHSFGTRVKSHSGGKNENGHPNAHSSVVTKSPSRGTNENGHPNAHSSVVTKSPSRGTNENGHPNAHSSVVTKSPSRGITERVYSNDNLCNVPMERPSKETEKPISNSCLRSFTTRKSSNDITENENLHKYSPYKSPSKETTEKEEKPTKEDERKTFTDSFENNNENKNSNLMSEICRQTKSSTVSAISNRTGETESLNQSKNENSHKELPKVDSPISNTTGNLVGLNVLRNIYQTCESNNIPLKSDNILKPNHTKNNTQVSNTVNKLEENLSSTRNENITIFDDNDDMDKEKHNAEVIHIVGDNPERVIASSNLNMEVENANECQELLKKKCTNDAKTVNREDVKLITADLLNRKLSQIEIIDEKLKERNIVLVEYGNENTKFKTNTNEENDTVPSHVSYYDYCEDVYKKISKNQDEERSNSHDSIKIMSEMTSLCVSPVNTVTTISNREIYRSKQDIYDKLDSASVSSSETSFQMLEKKSQIINITDLTYSLDDLARLDKICRIIEISDELSDKLFAPLDDRSDGGPSKQKWSFKDLCTRLNLDEFCNNVFGKTSM